MGFGTLVMPILMRSLLNSYSLQGTLIILSALSLHGFVFASVLSPKMKKASPKSNIINSNMADDHNIQIQSKDATESKRDCKNEIVSDNQENKRKILPWIMKKYLPIDLLKGFMELRLLLLANSLMGLTYVTSFTFIPSFAVSIGLTKDQGAYLVSAVGKTIILYSLLLGNIKNAHHILSKLIYV